MTLSYRMKSAEFDSRDFKDDINEFVVNLVKTTAELGDLDAVFEARMWYMDKSDLRRFQEVIGSHIEDGQFDEQVSARAVALGWAEKVL